MNRYRSGALAVLMPFAFAGTAQAATINVSHVLHQVRFDNYLGEEPLAVPFTAGIGGRVIFDLIFEAPDITIEGDTRLWLLSLTDSGIAGIETAFTWEFLSPPAPTSSRGRSPRGSPTSRCTSAPTSMTRSTASTLSRSTFQAFGSRSTCCRTTTSITTGTTRSTRPRSIRGITGRSC